MFSHHGDFTFDVGPLLEESTGLVWAESAAALGFTSTQMCEDANATRGQSGRAH